MFLRVLALVGRHVVEAKPGFYEGSRKVVEDEEWALC